MNVLRACESCGRSNRIPVVHLSDTGRCGACGAALPPLSKPFEANESEFDSIVNAARVPVLVDFWAPWCGPCRTVAPEVQQAAEHLAGAAIVLKVNTEEQPRLAARFAVRSIPNFAVFSGGELVWQQPGSMGHRQLESAVRHASSA